MDVVAVVIIAVAILAPFGFLMMFLQQRRTAVDLRLDDPSTVWRQIGASTSRPSASDLPADVFKSDVTLRDLMEDTTTGRRPAPAGCGGVVRGLVVGMLISVAGLAAAGIGFYLYTEFQDSADWPTTAGTVTTATISESYDSDDGSYSYQPRISYTYEVDGKSYRSDNIDFSDSIDLDILRRSYDSRSDAQKVLNKYPRGSTVTVIYNPGDPGRAVLEREYNDLVVWGLMIGGGIGFVIGLSVVIFSLVRGANAVLTPAAQPVPA